jgi:hypothetical protein
MNNAGIAQTCVIVESASFAGNSLIFNSNTSQWLLGLYTPHGGEVSHPENRLTPG